MNERTRPLPRHLSGPAPAPVDASLCGEGMCWGPSLCAAIDDYKTEIDNLKRALFECAEAAGEDTSDGVPTSPWIGEWAVRAVKELRQDYIDAGGG